jgi:hypothetical protein
VVTEINVIVTGPEEAYNPGAPGWEAVVDDALDWANRHVGAPAETAEPARV